MGAVDSPLGGTAAVRAKVIALILSLEAQPKKVNF